MTSRALLSLAHADVVLNGTAVLHDICWRLQAGEHWGIAGGNGSGKSTLLKLAAGVVWPAPDRGQRRYDFGDGLRTDAVEARRRIAWISDELQDRYARFNWNFSALEVVRCGIHRTEIPRHRPTRNDVARALELLAAAALTAQRARPFLTLSRGQQRRVLIARALASRPDILILDEPAAGLDAPSRRALNRTLSAIAQHTTIICAEHALEDLPDVVTHAALIRQGRIVAQGRLAALRRQRGAGNEGHEGSAGSAGSDTPAMRTGVLDSPSARTGSGLPLVRLHNADVWLGTRRVLRGLNWALQPGEQWLVRGANGSGKSTLLRLLHGQLRPAIGGAISWPALGNPRNVWNLRRRIAWLAPELQGGYRHPSTLRACVASGFTSSIGQTRPMDARQRNRVAELLATFELDALADRPLGELSYGQVKRGLICRAIVDRPAVLLLDEPWEGLDSDTAALVQARLDDLIRAGMHIVCASHWSRYAARHASRYSHCLTLADGRIVEAGEMQSGTGAVAAY